MHIWTFHLHTACFLLNKNLNAFNMYRGQKRAGADFKVRHSVQVPFDNSSSSVAWDDSAYETILAPHSRCDISSANRITDESDYFFSVISAKQQLK